MVGGGFATGCFFFTREVLEERSVWEHGVAGQIVNLSGEVTERSKLGITLFYEYELHVEYLDREGGTHRGKSEFDLLWSPLPEDSPDPTLRYDPQSPDRFVLSAPIEAGLSRWGMSILMGTLGALMLGALVPTFRNHQKKMRWIELCAEDGEEILAPLISATRVQGNITVKYSLPDRSKPVDDVLTGEPLILTLEGGPHLVVLRSPRDLESHLVIPVDLAPFTIAPETREEILKKARG